MTRFGVAICVLLLTRVSAAAQPSSPRLLTLEDAVAIAQRQGLGMRAATEQLESAEWRARATAARFRPRVSLSGVALNLDHSINSITLPDGTKQYVSQSNNQSFVGITMSLPVLTSGGSVSVSSELARTDEFGNRTARSWQSTPVTVSVSQPLFQPRRLLWDRWQNDAASALARSQYFEAREDVARAAVDAFFALYAADVTLGNASANASISETLLRVNQQRYATARISRIDLGRSELATLRARIDMDNARVTRERAESALRRTLSLPEMESLGIIAPERIPTLSIDPERAVVEALRNSSTGDRITADSVAALRELERAERAHAFTADVSGSIGFNQTASDLGLAYQSPLGRQRLMVSVQLPILQSGAGRAELEAARAEQSYLVTQAQMNRQRLAEEARFTALQTIQAMHTLALSAKADSLAATQFAIARAQYTAGNLTLTDYLLAQQDKDQAVAGHVQALRAFWTYYFALRRVTLFDFATGRRLTD